MRCLWLAWSLLTWLSAVLCTVGCLLPYWLKGYVYIPASAPPILSKPPDLNDPLNNDVYDWPVEKPEFKTGFPTDLGLFRRCGYPIYATNQTIDFNTKLWRRKFVQPVTWQSGCGHYSHITNVPHTAWHISFFTLITACALLFFATFFLFMLGFALYLISLRVVYRSCQVVLLAAGLLTLLSCALYPIGWIGNSEIEQACGSESQNFHLGRCQIGWAYVLTGSGGLLSLFAATLPIIFPRHLKQQQQQQQQQQQPQQKQPFTYNRVICKPTHYRHLLPCVWCNCCPPKSASTQSFTPGRSMDFLPASLPSPTNSIPAESVIGASAYPHPDSIVYLPTLGTQSPNGSSSPSASQMLEHLSTAVPFCEFDPHPHQSITSLHKTLPPSHWPSTTVLSTMASPPFPYMCAYVPQRYSTGALIGPYPSFNTTHPYQLNQRVSVSVNTDPLIYVAEEEEVDTVDTGDQSGDQSQKSAINQQSNHVGDADTEKTPSEDPQSTAHVTTTKHDASGYLRATRSTTDLTQPQGVPIERPVRSRHKMPPHMFAVRYIPPSAQHGSYIPGVQWVCPHPYTPLPSTPMVHEQFVHAPSGVATELIRRKRSSCII